MPSQNGNGDWGGQATPDFGIDGRFRTARGAIVFGRPGCMDGLLHGCPAILSVVRRLRLYIILEGKSRIRVDPTEVERFRSNRKRENYEQRKKR